jgi:hypothetical protein
MPRDQLHVYTRHVFPDNIHQPRTSAPSFFLLVDAHAMRVLSPLHVAGYREEGDFNKRLLTFIRFCFKQLEAQGRRSLASPIFSWRNKTFVGTRTLDGAGFRIFRAGVGLRFGLIFCSFRPTVEVLENAASCDLTHPHCSQALLPGHPRGPVSLLDPPPRTGLPYSSRPYNEHKAIDLARFA